MLLTAAKKVLYFRGRVSKFLHSCYAIVETLETWYMYAHQPRSKMYPLIIKVKSSVLIGIPVWKSLFYENALLSVSSVVLFLWLLNFIIFNTNTTSYAWLYFQRIYYLICKLSVHTALACIWVEPTFFVLEWELPIIFRRWKCWAIRCHDKTKWQIF